MKTIAYYISDYGYGHASRSIAIIRKLLEEPKVEIIVCHSFALSFVKASLNCERVSYRNIKTDIGYFLENDSIFPDKDILLMEYQSFVAEWDQYIQQEREFLCKNKVDLVISDISPLPFEAAASLAIPSVGISNFSWYTAYQGLIDEVELIQFKEAYQKMTYFYSLAGSQERWDLDDNAYGFFSREVNVHEVKRIRCKIDPNRNKHIIFLGLGMKIGVDSLEQLPIWDSTDCVFLVSSNVQVNRSNVYQIPNDYLESQNYIAASDLVISKAGWGMLGEAISANVPMLILNRPSMKEDQNTLNYLKTHHPCHIIEWDDFKNYQVDPSIMKGADKELSEKSSYNNNETDRIAADILKLVNDPSHTSKRRGNLF